MEENQRIQKKICKCGHHLFEHNDHYVPGLAGISGCMVRACNCRGFEDPSPTLVPPAFPEPGSPEYEELEREVDKWARQIDMVLEPKTDPAYKIFKDEDSFWIERHGERFLGFRFNEDNEVVEMICNALNKYPFPINFEAFKIQEILNWYSENRE